MGKDRIGVIKEKPKVLQQKKRKDKKTCYQLIKLPVTLGWGGPSLLAVQTVNIWPISAPSYETASWKF